MLLQISNFSEWGIIPQIGSIFSLIAFIAALVIYYLRNQSNIDLEKIKTVKEEDRADVLRDLYIKYKIKDEGISPDQRFILLERELEMEYRKRNQLFLFLGFITVVLVIAVIIISAKNVKEIPCKPIYFSFDNVKNGDTITNGKVIKGHVVGDKCEGNSYYLLLRIEQTYHILSTTYITFQTNGNWECPITLGITGGKNSLCIIECNKLSSQFIEQQLANGVYKLGKPIEGMILQGDCIEVNIK